VSGQTPAEWAENFPPLTDDQVERVLALLMSARAGAIS
jgi:hypothetical protein